MGDDRRLARLVARAAGRCIDVVRTDTSDLAIAAMRSEATFDGVIISLERLEGDGLAMVAAARELIGEAPVLVVSGTPDAEILNRAHAMRADYVVEHVGFEKNLLVFLREVTARCVTGLVACSRRLEALATRAELTVRETEVLAKALGSVPRSRIADSLGICENTLKTHIRSILSKTSQSSLSEVVWALCDEKSLADIRKDAR